MKYNQFLLYFNFIFQNIWMWIFIIKWKSFTKKSISINFFALFWQMLLYLIRIQIWNMFFKYILRHKERGEAEILESWANTSWETRTFWSFGVYFLMVKAFWMVMTSNIFYFAAKRIKEYIIEEYNKRIIMFLKECIYTVIGNESVLKFYCVSWLFFHLFLLHKLFMIFIWHNLDNTIPVYQV